MTSVGARLGIVSISLAAGITLIFELTLTRVLSFIFWNHVVYLTVTVALLGFGISGTLVAIVGRDKLVQQNRMGLLWFGLGLTLLLSLPLASGSLVLLTGAPAWAKLGVSYVIFVLPFIFSGALISVLLASVLDRRVGRLYAADLLASGAGCVAFFYLLPALGAPTLIFGLSAVAFLVGIVWTSASARGLIRANYGGAGLAVAAILVLLGNSSYLDFRPESYKEYRQALDYNPATEVEATTWTPIARIDVLGSNNGSDVGFGYPHPEGSYKIITQDGAAHTRLLSKRAIEHLNDAVSAGTERYESNLVYQIRHDANVAVIGVGGGADVAIALAYGARSVTGIELNPATAYYASEYFADYTGGLLDDPRVELFVREGRSFLTATDRRFDVIQVIAIDTFAALSSGAYALSENYLYTVEAFREYYRRLQQDGVLSFYRFLLHPPRETLRLTMLAAEAWRAEGETDFKSSVIVVAEKRGRLALAMFKRGPFTAEEVATLSTAATERGMQVLYRPALDGGATSTTPTTGRMAQASAAFNEAIQAVSDGREQAFFASYTHAVWPTHDDNPFFFEYNKLGAFGFPDLSKLRGDSVSATLLMILIQAAAFSLIAIMLPLALYRRAGFKVPGAGRFSAYFGAIGFAFMLVEISLMQKAVLFLGNPMHALSVVLATLLVGAGMGAAFQGRAHQNSTNVLNPVGLALIGMLVAFAFLLTPLFQSLIHLPIAARLAFVVALYLPVGAAMGVFLPTGLQVLRDERAAFVPWAWGINGCTSVFGSVLAILLALSHGFSVVIVTGAVFYLGAWLLGMRLSPTVRPYAYEP